MTNQEQSIKQNLDTSLNKISRSGQTHNRNFGLDLLRALAISLVLICHFNNSLRVFGFWGVEIFFGLSGFLIGQILWKHYMRADTWNGAEIYNFWTRRWWRTLPNYFLFFFVFLLFQYLSKGELPSAQRLSHFLWFGQDLLRGQDDFFGISWSLCVEEWFYFLFPLALYGFSKLGTSKKNAFFITILFFFVFCFITRWVLLTYDQQSTVRSVTLARIDAIGCGVLITYLINTIPIRYSTKIALAITGVILFSIQYFVSGYYGTKSESVTLVLAPLSLALFLPLISSLTFSSAPQLFKVWVERISLWSYSLYLSHIPILFTIYILLNGYRDSVFVNIISKVAALLLSIVVSAFLFYYFELPLTKMRKPELK